MPQFVKGLLLNESFCTSIVAPIINEGFPNLAYSAGRIGRGSDVLGFDTSMSTDHDWGPQIEVFLSEADYISRSSALSAYLDSHLPRCFQGYPVGFTAPDIFDNNTQCMDNSGADGRLRHRVSIHTVKSFLERHLGVNLGSSLSSLDWLSLSEQGLLEVTGGQVFHDCLPELSQARSVLSYYPKDVWLFRLAAQWHRLGQEEPFVGRCGVVDDDLGSRVVAARLVRDLMRLCFLLERRYAPYSKWLGTAFKQLACYSRMEPLLQIALQAETWEERERAIGEASSVAGQMQDDLGITPPVSRDVRQFHNRPFRVIDADRFSDAVVAQISDRWLRGLIRAGGVDQYCDCVDVLSSPAQARKLRALYNRS